MPSSGVNWLFECLKNVGDTNAFIEEIRVGNTFSELMFDSWEEHHEIIISDSSTLIKFNYIVGILVKSAQPVAITLQRKIE